MQKASSFHDDRLWFQNEFAGAPLPDERLRKRLSIIAADFFHRPRSSIPRACRSWARTKAAYRFFSHAKVNASHILAGHYEATRRRLAGQPVILAVQDTTFLNFSNRPQTKGLGVIGSNDKIKGFLVHTTMALTPEKVALGLMQVRLWARDPARLGQSRHRNQKTMPEKESQRWLESLEAAAEMARSHPGQKVVSVADREGDIYELLAAAERHPDVGVLVRLQHNRAIEGPQKRLADFIAAQPAQGSVELEQPRRPGQARRRIRLEIRFGAVTLQPPGLKENKPPVKVWMIEGRQAEGPLCWQLLCTLPVTTPEEAIEKLKWYSVRWQIEEFHRVLKSGSQTQERQLETIQRLQSVLALDLIVAWRIMAMTRAVRQAPQTPASDLFNAVEVRLLSMMIKDCPPLLTLREAARHIAQLGGFLARKSDGEPGPMTLWHGLQRLHDFSQGFLFHQNCG